MQEFHGDRMDDAETRHLHLVRSSLVVIDVRDRHLHQHIIRRTARHRQIRSVGGKEGTCLDAGHAVAVGKGDDPCAKGLLEVEG